MIHLGSGAEGERRKAKLIIAAEESNALNQEQNPSISTLNQMIADGDALVTPRAYLYEDNGGGVHIVVGSKMYGNLQAPSDDQFIGMFEAHAESLIRDGDEDWDVEMYDASAAHGMALVALYDVINGLSVMTDEYSGEILAGGAGRVYLGIDR
jgi:hypothetical protein